MNRSDRSSLRHSAALAGLLVLGLAARVVGAWCYRRHLNPDAGVAALMARHMAEGLPWPVFFYGQSYMGSLEPAVSAVLARIAGFSGFAVGLGTALLGFLTLPVVYRWARDAESPAAGRALSMAWNSQFLAHFW